MNKNLCQFATAARGSSMTTTHFSLEVGVEHVIVTLSALLRCSRPYCKGDGRPFKAVHLHSLEVMGIRASTRSQLAHTFLDYDKSTCFQNVLRCCLCPRKDVRT